jgi:N-acetylglucosamine kinase-like BadF-type ATPase
MILEALGISTTDELVPLMYEQHLPRTAVAKLAGRVERARAEGDGVASDLMARAADELVLAAKAVAQKLRFEHSFPIVLAGGVFQACPSLARLTVERLSIPLAKPVILDREPAYGAVALAIELLK